MDDEKELLFRIRWVLEYSKNKVVSYQYTRPAYEDLTSMGSSFTEPAVLVNSTRPMTSDETASAVLKTVSLFSDISGALSDRLRTAPMYCTNMRTSNDVRCMRCKGCDNFKEVFSWVIGYSS